MGRLPYFSKSSAVDDAREIVKEQMKRNTAKDIATERTRALLARSAAQPELKRQEALAVGSANLDNARRYTAGGDFEVKSGKINSPTFGGGSGAGSKGAAAFMQGLRDGGLTNPIGLSAAMGHAEAESGFDFNARGDYSQKTGRKMSYGGFQWNDRQPKMREWIIAQGQNPADPYWQGRFGAHEMETSEKGPGDRLKNATTLGEANEAMIAFLRPAGAEGGMRTAHRAKERQAASDYWYKKLTHAKPDEAVGSGGLVEEDINGEKVTGFWAASNAISAAMNSSSKVRKSVVPRLDAGVRNGKSFWQYVGPPGQSPIAGAPAQPGPTPPVVPAATANATQAPPVTAAPTPPNAPINPAPVAIQASAVDDEDDLDEEDNIDPWTGLPVG